MLPLGCRVEDKIKRLIDLHMQGLGTLPRGLWKIVEQGAEYVRRGFETCPL